MRLIENDYLRFRLAIVVPRRNGDAGCVVVISYTAEVFEVDVARRAVVLQQTSVQEDRHRGAVT